MGFIDNLKLAFNLTKVDMPEKYGNTKEWFLSESGRTALNETNSTVELTDYIFHYLKSILKNKELLKDDDLYRVAFVLADSVYGSNQAYAGKDALLNENVHPFIAYFQKLPRFLSTKSLCYEMLLILFDVVNPFDPSEWIYDTSRPGYSEEEYFEIAESHGFEMKKCLKRPYSGREDIRFIMCEIIWLLGQKDVLKKVI